MLCIDIFDMLLWVVQLCILYNNNNDYIIINDQVYM